jgi:hypothetical protein
MNIKSDKVVLVIGWVFTFDDMYIILEICFSIDRKISLRTCN